LNRVSGASGVEMVSFCLLSGLGVLAGVVGRRDFSCGRLG